ncbi:MAG: TPM domain-containing protein, partial [Chitinophagaceae bacterium]
MKRILFLLCLLCSLLASGQGINKVVPARPEPPRLVNDFSGKLNSFQQGALEEKLKRYNDTTSTQIAVVLMNTTGDYPIEDVGLAILRQWGVGTKEKDNGVVLLVAVEDRKVTIRTGYGMEGPLPDITAKNIIENDILPAFRNNQYYEGIDAGTNSIIKAAAGEYKAPPGYKSRQPQGDSGGGGGFGIGKII